MHNSQRKYQWTSSLTFELFSLIKNIKIGHNMERGEYFEETMILEFFTKNIFLILLQFMMLIERKAF